MHLFKGSILKPQEVEGRIVGLEPKAFNVEVPGQILSMVTDEKRIKEAFRIDELTAKMTGLSEQQQQSLEDKINAEVLKKLKEIKEKAYSEAYELGKEDGRKDAFEGVSAQINESLEKISTIVQFLESFKNRLFVENEEYFIKLIFHLAKCIVLKNIKEDKESIVPVLKSTLADTHSEEEIVVKLNKEDFAFIQTVGEGKQKPWESSKKIKFEVVENISRGGCIVETNYGIIDAQIEERLNKAWKNIETRIPKIEQT